MSKTNEFTDENFLHQYFHYYLHHMYTGEEEFFRNAMCDGFEEPLDPDYLCDVIYALADRLGYKLVNNMWEEE